MACCTTTAVRGIKQISHEALSVFFNSSQYGEYSMKYKERLFLTAQCSICRTVNYLTVDCICAVNELQYEMWTLQRTWLKHFFCVFMKQVITIHMVYLLIFCRFSWGFLWVMTSFHHSLTCTSSMEHSPLSTRLISMCYQRLVVS